MSKSVNVLFINPPITNIIDPSLPEVLLEEEDPLPPLGLMFIAAYLEKYSSHKVELLDCQVERINHKKLQKIVSEKKPDVVGIQTMTFTLIDVITAVKLIKQANPEITIVLGGPHVVIYPEETVSIKEVSVAVFGEGEASFKELLDNLHDKKSYHKIKGICFQDDDGKIINTGSRQLVLELDELPHPARHLTPHMKYSSSLAKRFPVTTMFTSRGCPFKCVFCDRPSLGKNFRAHSAKYVADEFEICQKMGIREIFIYDDTFGVDRQRVLDICSELKSRKIDMVWDIRTRVNTVDEEILRELKEAGCQRIHYGVEAGTPKILKILQKGVTLPMIEKAFRLTKEAGIQTLGYFMMGSPTETREDILETIELSKRLNPDFIHFTITTPYPATQLYTQGLNDGILPYDYWKEFAKNPTRDFKPLIWEEVLTKEELVKLLRKAYRSFYFRPLYIAEKLLSLDSFQEFKAKSKAAMSLLKI